ncbi:MAG: YitT family protein [Sphaerochaetaceae bacterium]|nr:YitT family protein [Sphaerochaetaceae bacterium]MDC7237649.1 YitT family protein [Sphaerochaetaceae bacterium]
MEKELKRYKVLEYFYIIIGTFLTALGVVLFANPAKIANGGVTGIAIILYHTLNFDVGTSILILSIPLFFVGLLIFGKEYGLKSLIGTLLYSGFVMLLTQLIGTEGIIDYNFHVSYLLSAIFGGILFGAGLGFVMKSGANTGGTDILAQIISKYTFFTLGNAMFIIDAIIIGCSVFIFGIEAALYAIITIYITSVGIDKVLLGFGSYSSKTIYIISEKREEIKNIILKDLDHGGTILEGKGLYTDRERPVIMTVMTNNKIGRLTNHIHLIDKDAFIIVHDAYQVMGEGFTPIAKAAWKSKHL